MTDWTAVTTRNARSVQTTIGWIFWDPGAVARYQAARADLEAAAEAGIANLRARRSGRRR